MKFGDIWSNSQFRLVLGTFAIVESFCVAGNCKPRVWRRKWIGLREKLETGK